MLGLNTEWNTNNDESNLLSSLSATNFKEAPIWLRDEDERQSLSISSWFGNTVSDVICVKQQNADRSANVNQHQKKNDSESAEHIGKLKDQLVVVAANNVKLYKALDEYNQNRSQ